ncbi:DUF2637 domain-containing protein [Rhodococcus sp. T2V]|uniref:DUF2637 domain-containing protein n=1 Tax=Rhodococcus sp. T2V TaxID=3034164 RepID=UPI0023E2E651|nr:DUF2637 domain-containing protein [Rhodococcus sp. T2V]MDF3308694.1 DUF2637 domain-containing protein [Rhodococcus sp. T2V]
MKNQIDSHLAYGIAIVAFILSYSKLVDLALRAGYGYGAYLWPLIVDGLAIMAARGVLRLESSRWYPWAMLVAGTAVSILAAVMNALVPPGPLPSAATAAVTIVPAACLPFALELARRMRPESQGVALTVTDEVPAQAVDVAAVEDGPPPAGMAPEERRDVALRLLATTDHSQRAVARIVGVTETTVRRWVKKHATHPPTDRPEVQARRTVASGL